MYIVVRIFKNLIGQIIICHCLVEQVAPIEGDYLYIFKGKWGNVSFSFSGNFTDKELKAVSNKLAGVDFLSHELKLISFHRGDIAVSKYVNSLKEGKNDKKNNR